MIENFLKLIKKDLTGIVSGELTVIGFSHKKGKRSWWRCQCNCGNVINVRSDSITSASTKSCGCLTKKRVTTHKMSGTRFYRIWSDMKKRCLNKNSKTFKWYGAKNINVCSEWLDFNGFYNDMYESYLKAYSKNKKCTLDRINNGNGYSKSNCRWVSHKENCNNRESTVFKKKVSFRDELKIYKNHLNKVKVADTLRQFSISSSVYYKIIRQFKK